MITIQNYVRAQNLEEAWELNQNKRNRILGGMMWLRLGSGSVGTAIDLCDLNLNTIEETEEEFTIGASVTLRDLERHEGLRAYFGNAVADSVKHIVGVQFRNMATVGGSIWGRFGFSDVLTAFLALDTYVELYKGGIVPLEEFTTMKMDRDILVRIIVKKKPSKIIYKTVRNQSTDFPVLACALSNIDGEYRLSIGARPSKAKLVRDEKGILSNGVHEQSIKDFAEYAAQTVETRGNMRGSAEYRTHLVKVLTTRCLQELEV